MVMVYKDSTLFVDLEGDIDMINFKRKLFSVVEQYNISNVVVNTRDVFNYKRRAFKEVGDDYSRVYNGKFSIER